MSYSNFTVVAETPYGVSAHPLFGLALEGILVNRVRQLHHYPLIVDFIQKNFHNANTKRELRNFFSFAKNFYSLDAEIKKGNGFTKKTFNDFINEKFKTSPIFQELDASFHRPSHSDYGLAASTPLPVPIPLNICTVGGVKKWHWASSGSAFYAPNGVRLPYEDNTFVEYHHHTNKLKETVSLQSSPFLPKQAGGRKGRFRQRKKPVMVTKSHYVTWNVNGEEKFVLDLLKDVTHIGDSHTRGEGEVLRWFTLPTRSDFPPNSNVFTPTSGGNETFIHSHTPPEMLPLAHMGKNQLGWNGKSFSFSTRTARPFPQKCVEKVMLFHYASGNVPPHGWVDQVVLAGLRPPFFHPHTRQYLHCIIPTME